MARRPRSHPSSPLGGHEPYPAIGAVIFDAEAQESGKFAPVEDLKSFCSARVTVRRLVYSRLRAIDISKSAATASKKGKIATRTPSIHLPSGRPAVPTKGEAAKAQSKTGTQPRHQIIAGAGRFRPGARRRGGCAEDPGEPRREAGSDALASLEEVERIAPKRQAAALRRRPGLGEGRARPARDGAPDAADPQGGAVGGEGSPVIRSDA